jgi:hypothetical protein
MVPKGKETHAYFMSFFYHAVHLWKQNTMSVRIIPSNSEFSQINFLFKVTAMK